MQVHGEGGAAGGREHRAERREAHAEEAAGRQRPGCEVLRRSGDGSPQLKFECFHTSLFFIALNDMLFFFYTRRFLVSRRRIIPF